MLGERNSFDNPNIPFNRDKTTDYETLYIWEQARDIQFERAMKAVRELPLKDQSTFCEGYLMFKTTLKEAQENKDKGYRPMFKPISEKIPLIRSERFKQSMKRWCCCT